jgi:hypothetical protein
MGHRSHAVTRRPELLCRAIKANGERCRTYAGKDGFCDIHAGRQDPRELGGKGGRGRTRSMLGITDEVADDVLRLKGKARLEALLDSKDERTALSAARALYSYGPARPPTDEASIEWHADRPVECYDMGELLRKLWEVGVLRCGKCDGPLVPLSELHAPVIRAELLDEGDGKFAGTSPAATGETGPPQGSRRAHRLMAHDPVLLKSDRANTGSSASFGPAAARPTVWVSDAWFGRG